MKEQASILRRYAVDVPLMTGLMAGSLLGSFIWMGRLLRRDLLPEYWQVVGPCFGLAVAWTLGLLWIRRWWCRLLAVAGWAVFLLPVPDLMTEREPRPGMDLESAFHNMFREYFLVALMIVGAACLVIAVITVLVQGVMRRRRGMEVDEVVGIVATDHQASVEDMDEAIRGRMRGKHGQG